MDKFQIIKVVAASFVRDHIIDVTFNDGTHQRIDFAPALAKVRVPEYQRWKQAPYFQQFRIEHGNIVWGEEWDIIFPVGQLYDNCIQ